MCVAHLVHKVVDVSQRMWHGLYHMKDYVLRVRMSQKLRERLCKEANAEQIGVSEWVRRALERMCEPDREYSGGTKLEAGRKSSVAGSSPVATSSSVQLPPPFMPQKFGKPC